MKCIGKRTLYFGVQLVLVMLLLLAFAFIFVAIEEKQTPKPEQVNMTTFWIDVTQKYDFKHITNKTRIENIMKEFETFFEDKKKYETDFQTWNERQEYSYLLKKWYHFTIISSTTIGYGDVAPSTQTGRLFFIFFLLTSIPAMVTLLADIGDRLTSLHHYNIRLVKRCCCYNYVMSESSLAVISSFFVIVVYIQIGQLFSQTEAPSWTYIDSMYYWLATFTTVGFGDINYPINGSLQYLWYRLTGLALVAGLVDALVVWSNERRIFQSRQKKVVLENKVECYELNFYGNNNVKLQSSVNK